MPFCVSGKNYMHKRTPKIHIQILDLKLSSVIVKTLISEKVEKPIRLPFRKGHDPKKSIGRA